MAAKRVSVSKTSGLLPGALVHVGQKRVDEVSITLIAYDEHDFEERDLRSAEECLLLKNRTGIVWD